MKRPACPRRPPIRKEPQGTVAQIFSDWRDVNGIRLPFEWTTMQGDKKFATVKIDNYKINSGLTPEVLSKKP